VLGQTGVFTMALDSFFHNKIESMKLEIIQGQAVLRRLEAQRNDYNSRVRLLREELGLLQQPGSYVGEVVKVMGTKKVLVKVHPEGKYGMIPSIHTIVQPALITDSLGPSRRCI
jgi:ATP-dependent 26S proteasome regulatory subunit